MDLGWAVVGYGGMGSWHHRNIEEKVRGLRPVGAFDIQPAALEKAAEAGLKTYGTLEELCADATVDIVTIATPNNFHKDIAIHCLQKGKHVVCEKPVTLNSGELEEILAVAKQTGKIFSVHQNRRWDKDFQIVKQAVQNGDIGQPYFIESRVQGSRGAMHGWRGYKLNGGGMLLDWGVHLLDQLLQLVPSPIVEVSACLLSVFTPEVEDNIKLWLRFENGAHALLEMSTNCFVNLPRWHISGAQGTLEVRNWNCEGSIVKLQENDAAMEWEDDIVYTEAGPTRTMAPRPAHTTQVLPLPDTQTDWTEYYQNVLAAIQGQAQLAVTPEQALRVMRVIDIAFAAAKDGVGKACKI